MIGIKDLSMYDNIEDRAIKVFHSMGTDFSNLKSDLLNLDCCLSETSDNRMLQYTNKLKDMNSMLGSYIKFLDFVKETIINQDKSVAAEIRNITYEK